MLRLDPCEHKGEQPNSDNCRIEEYQARETGHEAEWLNRLWDEVMKDAEFTCELPDDSDEDED